MIDRFAGRFVLLQRLGRGGMGTVFLARDESTGAECALKRLTLRPAQAGADARREFEALTRVRHPAVVTVHEFGVAPEGDAYLTMEYVPGVTADRALPRRDWRALAAFAVRVTEGLEALHAAGVVHGDLKPSNVLVLPGPDPARPHAVKLVDFGLAVLADRRDAGHSGTPGFAAPEVVRGQPPDAGADLYGLGALLYAIVSGRRPFESRDISSELRAQQGGPPTMAPLEESGMPAAFIQLLLTLLAPDPRERPAHARAVRLELERMVPSARHPLAERLRSVQMVGRERELARIGAWRAAPRRRTTVLGIAGEPGSGRTTMLDELSVRATLAGHPAYRLTPSADDSPGALVRVLMRRLADGAHVTPAPGTDDPVIEWLVGDRGLPLDRGLDALAERALTWAEVHERDGHAPLVLIDDTHLLDADTLALLRRIALHPDGRRLPMVWVGAPGAIDDALESAGVLERLALPALTSEALDRLSDARLGAPTPAVLGSFLARRSGGHPGLAVTLLELAAGAGAVREHEDGLTADHEALERIPTPAAFAADVTSALRRLPPEAVRAAEALAVWGRPAGADELDALVPGGCAVMVKTLIDAGLAERDEDGRVVLRAGPLAGALTATLSAEARVALHRAALAHAPLPPRERFRHLEAAGDDAKALAAAEDAYALEPAPPLAAAATVIAERITHPSAADWGERAGVGLVARGRHADALPHLVRAWELAPEGEAGARRAVLLSTALLRAGTPAEVGRVVDRALAAAPLAASRAHLLANDSARRHTQGDTEGAERAARAALEAAEDSEDDDALAVAGLSLGGLLRQRGALDEARGLMARAEQWAAHSGHAANQARIRGSRSLIAFDDGAVEEAERLARSAIELARAHAARQAEEELLTILAYQLTLTGQWSEACAARATSARLALEDGRTHRALVVLASQAIDEGLLGRPRTAWRRATRVRALARTFVPIAESSALRAQAQALRIAGRPRRAERLARLALERSATAGLAADDTWARIELARALGARSAWSACAEVCRAAGRRGPAADVRAHAILAALAGRAALRSPTPPEAQDQLAEAGEIIRGWTAPYAQAHIAQLRAEVLLAGGHRAEGIVEADRCLSAFAALPAPADRAVAALEFARMALADPAPPEPALFRWLEDAAGALERLGDHRGRSRALAMMVECHRRAAPAAGPAVAQGRSLIEAIAGLLASLSDPREVARRAMALAVEQLGADGGVLLFIDPEDGLLVPIAEHGAVDAATRRKAITYSRRSARHVIESGDSLVVSDAPLDPRARSDSVTDLQLRSILCVPMHSAGRVIGAVYLDSRSPDAFDGAHRSLLEGVAHLMAIAIEKSRGHDEVQRANEQLVGENLSLRQSVAQRYQNKLLIGISTPMQRVLAIVERAAATSSTVLITGENGTGKELVARVLQAGGKRRHAPFVSVNCGAIPEALLETELFGILSNVATGVRARDGCFKLADGGTLLLDEIGEMSPKHQVALLSVLASREITPVGGSRPIPVDVRVIAATNQDLRQLIAEHRFREDLFYRLNVIPIEVPPLREHKADIPALAQHFVRHFAEQQERPVPELTPEFMATLMQSDWPGNVRELQNYIERVLAMTPGSVLHPDPLPRDLEGRLTAARGTRRGRLADQVQALERRLLSEALERADGRIREAARALGLSETAMRNRMRKHGFDGDGHGKTKRRR